MGNGRWFNWPAVEWVMYERGAGLPSGVVWTLAVLASFVGTDGRAAYPSAETLATITGRSKRQIQRDLDELAECRIITRGDRRKVAHLRADHRPNVWDLSPAAREYIGRHRRRDDTMSPRAGRRHVTPPDSRDDKTALNGMTDATKRHDTMSPEELLKSSRKSAPPARDAGAAVDAPQTPSVADRAPSDLAAGRTPREQLAAKRAAKQPVTPSATPYTELCRRCGGRHATEGCDA